MATLHCHISETLQKALKEASIITGESESHIVMRALADALQVEHPTLFQVSTSGALVEGVYHGAVSVGDLLEYGDFGLGTFDDLDGEMIVLNGRCYRARGDGSITEPDKSALVPFAVVTHFRPERTVNIPRAADFDELLARLDALRDTQNLFFAVYAEGMFEYVKTRAVCKAEGHETLVETASKQALFEFHNVSGMLVGFWTPDYAKTVNIAGYHLHFLTNDHQGGGHLLDCRAESLKVSIEHAADFRMAIPETVEFLTADLTRDPTKDLDQAERQH